MNDIVNSVDGIRIVWTDANNVTHLCEGARLVDGDPDTFVLWAACANDPRFERVVPGSLDVPDGKAWLQGPSDVITCPNCKAKQG